MCWRGDTRRDERELRLCRAAIAAHFAEITDAAADLHVAEQIVGELLGNVQRYAPGPFCVEVHWSDGAPHLSVHDCGPCFDLSRVSSPDPASWEAERGRGLAIIQAVGGKVQTHRARHGGCRVSVEMPLENHTGRKPMPLECPHDHPASRGEHCPRIAKLIAAGADNGVRRIQDG
jgi:anti-sigma regulatory factor (Ser/Thr protein kinase)